jgi:hypothetical protein
MESETPSTSFKKMPAIQSSSQQHNPPLRGSFLALLKHLVVSVGELHIRALFILYIGSTFWVIYPKLN